MSNIVFIPPSAAAAIITRPATSEPTPHINWCRCSCLPQLLPSSRARQLLNRLLTSTGVAAAVSLSCSFLSLH